MSNSTRARRTLLALFSLALAATSAAGSPRDERYFAAYGGVSTTGDSYIHLRQPGTNTNVRLNGVAWNDKSFESPLYYGFRAVQYSSRRPWLGYGVDFFHYKVYADPTDPVEPSGVVNGQPVSGTQPLGNFIRRFSISHGVNYVTFVVMVRTTSHIGKPFNEGRFRAYAGVGAGPAILHPEAAIGDDFKEKYQYAGWGWQAFGGVEYLLDSGKAVFAEGKFSNDSFKVDVPGGTARTRLSTRHVAVGVSFKM
jgi:opacity protein-like surface antigen